MGRNQKRDKAQMALMLRLNRTNVIGSIVSTSCGYPVIQNVKVTRVISPTMVATELVVSIESATPAAKLSPETTITPPTSRQFIVWDTQQVVEAFQAAGLEMSNPRPMTFDDYG